VRHAVNVKIIKPERQPTRGLPQALQRQCGPQAREPGDALSTVPRGLTQNSQANATPRPSHTALSLPPSLPTRGRSTVTSPLGERAQQMLWQQCLRGKHLEGLF